MWKAFGSAFGLTFIAEIGDKTQLAILTLSARYGALPVFLGAALAFVLLNALAVTAGVLIASYVPEAVVRFVAAGFFVLFGILSLRPEEPEQEEDRPPGRPFLTSLAMVALLELGDKTQLSLVAMTSRMGYPFVVFLGGTLALFASTLLGILAGRIISRILPFKYIRRASGAIFILFGILIATGIL